MQQGCCRQKSHGRHRTHLDDAPVPCTQNHSLHEAFVAPLRTATLTLLASAVLLAACGGSGPTGGEPPAATAPPDPPATNTGGTAPADPPPAAGGGTGGGGTPPAPADPPPADPDPTPPPASPPASDVDKTAMGVVSAEQWNDTAVRKVLHTFAYGGESTDAQVQAWAAMDPLAAIEEMLTFDEHNLKLSPPAMGDADDLADRSGTMAGLAAFWASDDPANNVAAERRDRYTDGRRTELVWGRAAVSRGLNPFRQKIGLFETNYHLAVNREANVTGAQAVRYYDDIMDALAAGLAYEDVLAVAASSAAVAMQYDHRRNRYRNGVCECNEDFAREFYQLFFGIRGMAESAYHETVTIKNTAMALTDMPVHVDDLVPDTFVSFGTAFHYPGALEAMHAPIAGTTALESISELAHIAIAQDESLDELPVMIVSTLADDNLDDAKRAKLRAAWRSMDRKRLLPFLRAYAVSPLFHDASRVKYLTTFDRTTLVTSLLVHSDAELDERYWLLEEPQQEGTRAFHPVHNVFGGQTGLDAADDPLAFAENYNRSVRNVWTFRNAGGAADGYAWTRDWGAVIPADDGGNYLVADVAAWLWQRFVADGLKNFGSLERAHLYAILATDTDLASLVNPLDPDRVITSAELDTDPALRLIVDGLALQPMGLTSSLASERLHANRRVGTAVAFIAATPYMFVQEGT